MTEPCLRGKWVRKGFAYFDRDGSVCEVGMIEFGDVVGSFVWNSLL